jgi:UDP-N-acetylglucosamine--N-acetylmuramyl-(pentapeptide) pyrophosphoryl-undecaprenol N-acetylglucosamine transferase
MKPLKIIISGGGTGGHIFPAVSIANALQKCGRPTEILFVGAEGRMEMERVPAAGYKIIGLPIVGFDRKHLLKNIGVLIKIQKSMRKARRLLRDFRPDIAIGVGGYASGPLLKAAQRMGIPTLIQEQNSYAGVTNKLLAKNADRICVAYEHMERFFPADKIVITGNPVRREILEQSKAKELARRNFGLDTEKPTVLVVGGSLGARTLNESMEAALDKFSSAGVQVIWQTGKFFGTRGQDAAKGRKGVVVTEFISNMAAAYSAADLVVSRAGACAISEIELLGKPSILVPSPNVAEDHQTKNAQALESVGAALLVRDADARSILADTMLSTLADTAKLKSMSANTLKLARTESDSRIAAEALKIIDNKK